MLHAWKAAAVREALPNTWLSRFRSSAVWTFAKRAATDSLNGPPLGEGVLDKYALAVAVRLRRLLGSCRQGRDAHDAALRDRDCVLTVLERLPVALQEGQQQQAQARPATALLRPASGDSMGQTSTWKYRVTA